MASRKGLGRGLDSIIPKYRNDDSQPKESGKTETTGQSLKEKTKTDSSSDQKRASGSKKPVINKTVSTGKEHPSEETENKSGYITVRLSKVEPNQAQPREEFNEDALQELAESIRQVGILSPLIVQKRGDRYEIIAGERRWRAARLAGLKEVPVIVKDLSDREILEVSLIENIQREDLNAIEEAKAYRRLMEEFHLKQDELAERVSKSRTAITNTMRLLKLDDKVQEMLINDMISAGHARALLALDNPVQQQMLANRILDEKLSVRETEKIIRDILKPKPEKKRTEFEPDEALLLIYHDMEEKMRSALGTKVIVNYKTMQKGKLEIEYYSNEELERIYDLIRRGGNEAN